MAGLVKDNDVVVTRTIVGGGVTKDNDVVVTRTTTLTFTAVTYPANYSLHNTSNHIPFACTDRSSTANPTKGACPRPTVNRRLQPTFSAYQATV